MKKGKPEGGEVEGFWGKLGRVFGVCLGREERPVGGVDFMVDLLAGGSALEVEVEVLSSSGGSQKAVGNVM